MLADQNMSDVRTSLTLGDKEADLCSNKWLSTWFDIEEVT